MRSTSTGLWHRFLMDFGWFWNASKRESRAKMVQKLIHKLNTSVEKEIRAMNDLRSVFIKNIFKGKIA